MPLNLSTNDGDFTPYLKYNTKAGRFYVKPPGGGEEVEVQNPRLAFDMKRIRTGWIYYPEGSGPEKVWDPSPTQMAPKPPGPKKFKRGFEVFVFGADAVLGIGKIGLREFTSTATNCIAAILAMYADYEAGLPQHPNEYPFFQCMGVKPVNGAYGTNYEPQFILKAWVPAAKIPDFSNTPTVDWESVSTEPRPATGFAANAKDDGRFAPPPSQAPAGFDDPIPFAPEWR